MAGKTYLRVVHFLKSLATGRCWELLALGPGYIIILKMCVSTLILNCNLYVWSCDLNMAAISIQWKSIGSKTTWGWVNDDSIFYFYVNYPFSVK